MSWIFVLFLANRYTPLVHFIWVHITMFGYNESFCKGTKWVPSFHGCAGTVFAHAAVALRIYAITNKNKWLGRVLVFALAFELVNTFFWMIWNGLGPLAPLPKVNLDAFQICLYKLWDGGALIYYSTTMFFDVVAFSIVVFTARSRREFRYPGMPSILDTILRDATLCFVLIFSAHCLLLFFLLVNKDGYWLLPAMANTTFIPLMASRLMLSLKKAAANQKRVWSLETMSNPSLGRTIDDGTTRFVSRVPGGSHEIPLRPMVPDVEDTELGATSRSSRDPSPMP